jgi:glutamate N-acetyltransferase/amino-acid N-acetyltransferase
MSADDVDGCPGFRFAGVAAGIKNKGGLDVGLIAADGPCTVGAVFTRNRVKAAPVIRSSMTLRAGRGRARAVVVNSGNANACTGTSGARDARTMQRVAAGAVGCAPEEVLVASTGIIGRPLPMPRVEDGIRAAGAQLSRVGFAGFAEAIMTTDRRPKTAAHRLRVGAASHTLLGTTKGAGMIAPNMATTLTFITTDVAVTPRQLQALVATATASTFNAITVDGDTSTNDTLMVLASGRSRSLAGAALRTFAAALTELMADLARQLIADGEGVHHVVTVEVRGAGTAAAAAAVARRVATSPLVKTAIAGGDPNWGRILCAVGNAGIALRPEALAVSIGPVPVVKRGIAAATDLAAAARVMRSPEYTITIDVGTGAGTARHLACDLSHEYVSINADYTT